MLAEYHNKVIIAPNRRHTMLPKTTRAYAKFMQKPVSTSLGA